LLVALALACHHPTPAPPVPADPEAALLDDWLDRLEPWGVSGTLLVAHGDHVVLERGLGPGITPETPFLIGSLSKQFTAAAILELEERGALSVDDRIERFFPDAPADKRAITLHQLMTHTAGLPYLPAADLLAPAPRPQVIAETLALPLSGDGSYSYSTPGFTLLAAVVEVASGERYEDFVREALFEPAGMTHTGFIGEPQWDAATVHSSSDGMDEGALGEWPTTDRGFGAGTVVTTPGDLYAWVTALRTDRIFGAAEREKLWTPHVPTGQPGFASGYGWNVVDTPRGRIIAHAGDIGGWNADCRYYVDRDLVVIFTSNVRVAGAGWRDAVMNNASLLLAGEPIPQPPVVVAWDAATRSARAGDYAVPEGRIHVGEDLVLSADAPATIALLAGAPGDPARDAAAATVASALAVGDLGPLQAALDPSLPFVALEPDLRATLAARDLGAFAGVDVLGTAVASPSSARTWYRVRYERGAVLESFAWSRDRIVGLETDLDRASAVAFQPESADTATAFDAFTGHTVRIRFDDGGLTFVDAGVTAPRA
jgi:CubicO group peptidase (beta-lactamase class C family)